MALRSGSLKRNGMLETWSRLGISLGEEGGQTTTDVPPESTDPATVTTVDPSVPTDDEVEAPLVLVAAATACAAAAAAAAVASPPFCSSCCCCC